MPKYKPFSTRDFDKNINPANDFYHYVNGRWIKRNKIPDTENRWGSFLVLRKNNKKALRNLFNILIKNNNLKSSDEKKLRIFYLSAMDSKKRNRQKLEYINDEIERIENITNTKDLVSVIAHLQTIGAGAPWCIYVDQDDKNSEKMVFRIHQSGLGMPDRNYYIKKDKDSLRIKSAYKKHIAKMFSIEGNYSKDKIRSAVKTIIEIESKLSKASMTRVQLRDIESQYNKKTIKQIINLYPNIDWKTYLQIVGVFKLKDVIVDQIKFIECVNTLFVSMSIEKWKVYLHWHLIRSYAYALNDDFVNEDFSFNGKIITGTKKIFPDWEKNIQIASIVLRDIVGKMYVKKYFPENSKKRMEKLVNNLVAAYEDRIEKNDWMSRKTKNKAIEKLKKIQKKIGYPTKWINYQSLKTTDESFVKNCIDAYMFDFKRDIHKLSKPADRGEWYMSTATVNAYYNPNFNEIVFPAGILQPPFFSPHADDAVNYGAIGAIIGHEITHGFDDKGSEFDEKGNFNNWWTLKDRNKFNAKTKRVIKQFNRFKIIDNICVNGELTLGENIADLGGLVIAHKALQISLKGKTRKKIDGFTPEQRFFISAAIAERGHSRSEFLKLQVRTDPHSPNEFRVNGPLSNMSEFYDAFGVTKGDGMYKERKDRIVIW